MPAAGLGWVAVADAIHLTVTTWVLGTALRARLHNISTSPHGKWTWYSSICFFSSSAVPGLFWTAPVWLELCDHMLAVWRSCSRPLTDSARQVLLLLLARPDTKAWWNAAGGRMGSRGLDKMLLHCPLRLGTAGLQHWKYVGGDSRTKRFLVRVGFQANLSKFMLAHNGYRYSWFFVDNLWFVHYILLSRYLHLHASTIIKFYLIRVEQAHIFFKTEWILSNCQFVKIQLIKFIQGVQE